MVIRVRESRSPARGLDSDIPIWKAVRGFDGLGYDLAEEPRFFTVEASVGALVLPFARRVENQFVLGI